MFRIGGELLDQSKASIEQGKTDKKAWSARDLLSILVRANAMPDIAENQRLDDEDVLAREEHFCKYCVFVDYFILIFIFICRNSYVPCRWSRNNQVS